MALVAASQRGPGSAGHIITKRGRSAPIPASDASTSGILCAACSAPANSDRRRDGGVAACDVQAASSPVLQRGRRLRGLVGSSVEPESVVAQHSVPLDLHSAGAADAIHAVGAVCHRRPQNSLAVSSLNQALCTASVGLCTPGRWTCSGSPTPDSSSAACWSSGLERRHGRLPSCQVYIYSCGAYLDH